MLERLFSTTSVSEEELTNLHCITQPTRGNLIQTIIGHPKEAPSLDELDYTNPSVTKSTIKEHLDALIDRGIVKQLQVETGKRDLPTQFYTLTEYGRDLMENHDIFMDEEEQIKAEYNAVEKPERIERHEAADRPTS